MIDAGAVTFLKGHGTGNDFVVLPDPDDVLTLTPQVVRALCDRRFGIGADGVLRVVPAAAVPDLAPTPATWFMDYWNADGSVAEMCGNGARVFARHLVDTGGEAPGEFPIATRGGTRLVHATESGPVTVAMGLITAIDAAVQVHLGEATWQGHGWRVPNPHAVAFVPALSRLGDLHSATATPAEAYPAGVNIEFVEVVAPDHIAMRVLERGSGETLSCGTGACAAAWSHRRLHGGAGPVTVAVPGGTVEVVGTPDGQLALTGPAEFVALGYLDAGWWERIA